MTNTILDVMHERAIGQPSDLAYEYVGKDLLPVQSLSYKELWMRSNAVAHSLINRGLAGKHLLLMYPSGLDFITAFFGAMLSGSIPIPTYTPTKNSKDQRLRSILESVEIPAILTVSNKSSDIVSFVEALGHRVDVCATDELTRVGELITPTAVGSDAGFIQFTSGSTSRPKGVVVSHNNIISNQQMIKQGFGHGDDEVVVGWLPFFHDMGLIGNIMQPLYLGCPSILMAPSSFLQRPLKWLELISKYRATTSGGPNFSYDYCVTHVAEEQIERLDLSSWRLAYNGAEMVRESTLEKFADRFSRVGFNYESFFPCYGLAEGTLYVTGNKVSRSPDALARSLAVCVGQPNHGTEISVVDPKTCREAASGEVGEIWVQGDSVCAEYINEPDLTAYTFEAKLSGKSGTFLRTGDLGYLQGQDLHITGRLKNLLVVNGKNYHGEEIEHYVSKLFSSFFPTGTSIQQLDEGGVQTKIILVQELKRDVVKRLPEPTELEAMTAEVRARVLETFGVGLSEVSLAKQSRLPRTSSGKMDRGSIVALLQQQQLETLYTKTYY